MSHGSMKVVLAALAGNVAITVSKFSAAFVTNSSAMMSEAIHSSVDSLNQVLLLVGMNQSKKPETENFQFGHGLRLYFWAFIVATMIFGMGAIVSFYEGYEKVLHREDISFPIINFIVLGLSVAFEGVSWYTAWNEFKKNRKSGFLKAIKVSKDPVVFTVLIEDTAAIIGLFVAMFGLFLSYVTGNSVFDGISSIFIGFLLTFTALFIANECYGLMTGESVDGGLRDQLFNLLSSDKSVMTPLKVMTMYFGPHDILLAVEADFNDDLSADDVEVAIEKVEKNIKNNFPDVKKIFIEPKKEQKNILTGGND